jgi:putative acetyltransferase
MLRRAHVEDASAICRVHMASIRGLGPASYSAEQVEAWCGNREPESYLSPIRERIMFVAEHEGQVVGFSQLDHRSSVVDAVYVHPARTRTGLGTLLLRAVEAAAVDEGLSGLSLVASLNAVAFYREAGYVLGQATSHRVGASVPIPCVHMSRSLAAPS